MYTQRSIKIMIKRIVEWYIVTRSLFDLLAKHKTQNTSQCRLFYIFSFKRPLSHLLRLPIKSFSFLCAQLSRGKCWILLSFCPKFHSFNHFYGCNTLNHVHIRLPRMLLIYSHNTHGKIHENWEDIKCVCEIIIIS